MIHRLQTTQISMKRCMLGISRRKRKRITGIRNLIKVFDIIEGIQQLKWKWAGILQEDVTKMKHKFTEMAYQRCKTTKKTQPSKEE